MRKRIQTKYDTPHFLSLRKLAFMSFSINFFTFWPSRNLQYLSMRRGQSKQSWPTGPKQSIQMLDINDNREDSMGDEMMTRNSAAHPREIFQQLDIRTLQCSSDTINELTYLLTVVLKYPLTYLAEKHSQANRLGAGDLIDQDGKVHGEAEMKEAEHCPDCGLIVQEQSIPFCSPFHTFPNIGIAAYLLFATVKNLSILLLVLGSVYSGYALYINIAEPSSSLSLSNMPSKLSYATILLNYSSSTSLQTALIVESWLLVAVIVIWMICLFLINWFQIKHKRLVDNNTITAADFSVMIENVPFGMTQEQLQGQFDAYHARLMEKKFITAGSGQNGEIQKFRIKKVCKALPYSLLQNERVEKQIEQIEEEMTELRELFSQWVENVKERSQFPLTTAERQRGYTRFGELRAGKNAREKVLQHQAGQNIVYKGKTTIFVSFQDSQSANLIGELNPHTISAKINYYLSCCTSALYFSIPQTSAKLSRAPQPEDINWQNIGVQFSSIICRKCVTYLVTGLLLAASFGIVYGLTLWQISTNNSIITYIASISISLLNVLIGVAVEAMTVYQRDFTRTNREISYALKSIMAQLMNSILVPLITNILVKDNLYNENGLIYDIFFLGLTNSLLPPLLQFLNIGHIVNRFIAWWQARPYQKLSMEQQSLNKYLEFKSYELGYAYIYYMNMFYFTCFYVTMQPYVVVPALIGFFLMFWADKYKLLYNSTRPVPSSELLADAMGQLVFFSPFVLAIGNLTWYNFINHQTIDFTNMVHISRIAALGVSLLFFLLPVDSIVEAVCSLPDDEVLSYNEVRGKLTSEYDRLNPATKEDALRDFLDFLSDQKRGKLLDFFKFPQKIDSLLNIAQKPEKTPLRNNPTIFQNNPSEVSQEELRSAYPTWNRNHSGESVLPSGLAFEELKEEESSFEKISHQKIILGVGSPNRRSRYTRKRVMAGHEKKSNTQAMENEFKVFQSDMKGYHSVSLKQQRANESNTNPYFSLKF